VPCHREGSAGGEEQGRFRASVSPHKAAISQGKGEVGPWLIFLLLFQLSAVEAGGSTAFIHANFSVPVVKVRENRTSGEGETQRSCVSSLAGSCGQACHDAKPQRRGSLICFGVLNPSPGAPGSLQGESDPNPAAPNSVSGC